MRIQRFISELCIFKNRASSSKNEQRAAQHIYQFMRTIGLVANVQEFPSQKSITWELITIFSFFIIESILYFYIPVIALIFGLIGVVLFWGYFTTRFKPFSKIFRRSKSTNVIGKLNNPNTPYKVIFTAHHDTASSGLMWHPKLVSGFRMNFLLGLSLCVLLQVITVLKLLSIHHDFFQIIAIGVGIFIFIQILVLLYSKLSGDFVQGASDNASGVAVMLDLAARLKEISIPEIEFWFVSTGSEEVGAIGMSEFLIEHEDELEPDNTYFINIDNVGKGNLHYYSSEGMIYPVKFSKDLINTARKTAQQKDFKDVKPRKYKLAFTDAIVTANAGFKSILFLATDDSDCIPNWHWKTDTIENIDLNLVQKTSDFIFEMMQIFHKTLATKIEKTKEDMAQFTQELANSDL